MNQARESASQRSSAAKGQRLIRPLDAGSRPCPELRKNSNKSGSGAMDA
jgi:hypothetical protein